MTKWKKFDVDNPPSNWCLITINDVIHIGRRRKLSAPRKGAIMAKWSRTHYAWIGLDLIPIIRNSSRVVTEYLELDYPTLNDMIYNPRPKRPEPKYYNDKLS